MRARSKQDARFRSILHVGYSQLGAAGITRSCNERAALKGADDPDQVETLYPRNVPDDIVGDDYFWVKLTIDERPAFILSHRLIANSENMHLVGIRDYYISHFFDVSQRVAVVARLESGKHILIFVERAWVDYWSSFASLGKKIGHKVMKKQMEHLLEDHGICGQ